MFPAWKQISADFVTTKSVAVICVNAALLGSVFAAIARLDRAHECTRRARTRVALHRARVRAGAPRFGACLAT